MSLPRAYRNYRIDIPQWSIRVTGGTINHPTQGDISIQPPRDAISVCKDTNTEYLYLRLINSCPNSYYVLSEEVVIDGILIATINKVEDDFEIINVNVEPI